MKKIKILIGLLIIASDLHSQESSYNNEIHKCLNEMFIHDNPPLIVDWTRKAGSTCIWLMLFEQYGLLQEALQYSSVPGYVKQVYSKSHKATIDKFFNKNYCKVKCVRNPYYRIVSSYLQSCKAYTFKNSFESFLISFKKQDWKNIAIHNIHAINRHTQEQYKETDQFMDYIVKIEETDFSEINKKTGLNLSLCKYHLNHHNSYLQNYDTCVATLKFKDIEKRPYPPCYAFYNKKTLYLIEELFHEDIINYGYTLPDDIKFFMEKTTAKD